MQGKETGKVIEAILSDDLNKAVIKFLLDGDNMGKISSFFKAAGKGISTAVKTGSVKQGWKAAVSTYRSEMGQKTQADTRRMQETHQKKGKEVREQFHDNARRFADSFGDASYDVDTSNAYEIRRMNEELHQFQESIREKASGIEDETIAYVQGTIRDMIQRFEEINDEANLSLNIAYLKEMETRLSKQVKGYIQNRVKRRLSIDDAECKEILAISGSRAKEMAMHRLQEEIFSDALNDLWNIINDTFQEQNTAIFNQIENRLTTIRMNTEESIRQFEEIKRDKQSNKEELEAKQQNYQNLLDIATWCAEALEGEI